MRTTSRKNQQVRDRLLEYRLITPQQLAEADKALKSASAEELGQFLQRQEWITSYQWKMLERGETSGYYFGPYKVQYLISAGSFARVFRAQGPGGEAVAIKALRTRHSSDSASVDQFYREAMLTRSLAHPNITRTIDVGIDRQANKPYLVMEFIEGGNLRQILSIRKMFTPEEMVRLGREMVEGLRYAWLRKVTHRDIKPTNILMSSTGTIKWVDFGLAGSAEGGSDSTGAVTDRRTVDYAALEKATGAPKGDFRSDIFFLGIVWYEMLSGQAPLPRPTENAGVLRRIQLQNIQPLSKNRSVPDDLARIVDRMTAFRPQERYQDYDELLSDLTALPYTGAPAVAESTSQSSTKIRVAFVHRNQKVQERAKGYLNKHGMQVVLTTDLKRAITIAEMSPFDCMVLDLKTVGTEGLDVYSRYLQKLAKRGGQNCPAVFLAESEDQQWTKKFPSGQVAVLAKDTVTARRIFHTIQNLVKSSRKRVG